MISIPVDVVGECLSCSLIGSVEAIGLVTITLTSDFGTVMFGFTVSTPLLTIRCSVVVPWTGFLVGVTVFVILADVIGLFTGISVEERVESLEVGLKVGLKVVFGAVVRFVECGGLGVRARLFLVVVFVSFFLRVVKVVTLLRVGVTLGVFDLLFVTVTVVGSVP